MSLYPGHVRLSALEKGAVAVMSGIGAVLRPERADLVAAVGETTGEWAAASLRKRLRNDPVGREILKERPRVTNQTLALCRDLPSGTFGHAYAKFMIDRRFEADDRPAVRYIDDEELAYVVTRSREVHDFWHVLFGCPTSVLGELALKGVEYVQTGLPMAALAVLTAQYRLPSMRRAVLWQHYVPWAMRAGLRSQDLLCIYYERHLQEDLNQLRQKWRIEVAPSLGSLTQQ